MCVCVCVCVCIIGGRWNKDMVTLDSSSRMLFPEVSLFSVGSIKEVLFCFPRLVLISLLKSS